MSAASLSFRSIGRDVSAAVIATMAFLTVAALTSKLSLPVAALCSAMAILACLWLVLAAINDLVWPVRRGPARTVQVLGDWLLITGGITGKVAAASLILPAFGA